MSSPHPSNALNVAIVVFDDVQLLDFTGPFEVFSTAAAEMPPNPFRVTETYSVGLSERVIRTSGGLEIRPGFTIENCPAPDILIVPGGLGSRRLIKHQRFMQWLREQHESVQAIASVCTGALALGAAGLLNGRQATTHHCAFNELISIAPDVHLVRDKRYVQDGNVWTSGGISAGIDMSLAMLRSFLNDDSAVIEEMEWHWHA